MTDAAHLTAFFVKPSFRPLPSASEEAIQSGYIPNSIGITIRTKSQYTSGGFLCKATSSVSYRNGTVSELTMSVITSFQKIISIIEVSNEP